MMRLCDLQKTTLLDFPGRVAATVFTGGCNMRCIYCHNSALVLDHQNLQGIGEEEFFSFLDSRRGKLEGVCITGGEPTLQEDLLPFMERIRSMGFLVKLDTNGLKPRVLERLFAAGYPDMVAMDIKSDLADYPRVTGIDEAMKEAVSQSAALVMGSGVEYEFRTTVPGGFFKDEHFEGIGRWLRGCRAYYLQAFRDSGQCLYERPEFNPGMAGAVDQNGLRSGELPGIHGPAGLREPAEGELERFREILLGYMDNVGIRGL